MAAVGADAPLYRSNAPISIFAEEDHRMGTRKRANTSEETQIVAEQEPHIEVVAEVEPEIQTESEAPTSAEEEAEVVEAIEAEQPKLRRCPRHHVYFPDEDE